MKPADEWIDPLLERKLDLLRTIPQRDPVAADKGRADFLAKAQSFMSAPDYLQAVSQKRIMRHREWINNIITLFDRKERSPMFTTLISLIVTVSLLFGGAGATVYAAQNSQPDQALYGVKTLSENVRIELAGDAQTQLALSLQFADRRVNEMSAMVQKGAGVPEPVLNRYHQQLDQALQLAAGLGEAEMAQALEQVQQHLRIQEQVMLNLQSQTQLPSEAVLQRVREMVQMWLHLVESGLHDPAAFRDQVRQGGAGQAGSGEQPGGKSGEGTSPGLGTPGSGNGYGTGPQATGQTPGGSGNSYGPGPQASGTPAPGSSYGPGPGPSASATPGSGYGPGPNKTEPAGDQPKDGTGNGPGPNPTEAAGEQPQDGTGNGPGPNPTEASGDQSQDGSGYGPGPNQDPGSGSGAGSNPDQPDGGSGPGPAPDSTCTPQGNQEPQATQAPADSSGGDSGTGSNSEPPADSGTPQDGSRSGSGGGTGGGGGQP